MMATVSIVAWRRLTSSADLDATFRDLIESHGGRVEDAPGLARFTDLADALGAAVAWQRHEQPVAATVIAVNTVEVDQAEDLARSAAASMTLQLAERGHPGDILALDVVRLLVPAPADASWDDELAQSIGEPPRLVHQLRWQPTSVAAPTRVVVADDAAIIRAGLVSLLRADGMDVVGEAGDYQGVLDQVRATRPHLLITDVRMPPTQQDEGLRAAAVMRAEQPGLAVLVLSQYVRASAAADLLTGQTSGVGYLLKERVTALEEFLDAARAVAGGATVIDSLITQELFARRREAHGFQRLGGRERAVLELMARGLSNAAIASELVLSGRTVESHVRSIMTKLDLGEDPAGHRRVQAVIHWLDQH